MATGIKTGGRIKGTQNKDTAEIRENFQLLIENNLLQLETDLQELEPKDRIKAILELAKFVLPTLRSTELTTENENDFRPIVINLGTGINPELLENE